MAAVRGGRGLRPARSASVMGQRRTWSLWEEAEWLPSSSRFIFPACWELEGGWGGCWFQWNTMDQTSWKINRQSQRATLCHRLYCTMVRVIHSITCARVCKRARTHKLTHTHHLVTLWLCRHCPPICKHTSQMKAQLHIRVGAPLTSWPNVMDCSLLRLKWDMPGLWCLTLTTSSPLRISAGTMWGGVGSAAWDCEVKWRD